MNIKLDHINLTVSNLDESIAWYEKIFGFRLVEQGISIRNIPWGIVALNDSMICMSEHGSRKSAASSDEEKFHQIYHFGIRVSDQEEWKERVKAFNLKLYYGGVVEYPHSKSWYVHDPNGHEIEVSWAERGRMEFEEHKENR